MGRGKIDIKRIENASSRQVTFAKRRVGLFKKAQELAILCDADVGLIIFSSSGKRFEFASSSMQNVIKRYMKSTASKEAFKYQSNNPQDVETLQSTCKNIIGEEIQHLSLPDLSHLEKQMDMGLTQVRAQKGRLLLQEMEALNNKGKKLQTENKDLKTKIEEMQKLLKEAQSNSLPTRETFQSSIQPTQPNLYVTSTTKKCSPLQLF